MLLLGDLLIATLPATTVTARPAPHRGPHRRELREGGAGRNPRQAVQDHGPIAATRTLPGEAGALALGEAGRAQAADQEAVEGRRGNAPRLHPRQARPGGSPGGPGAASPAAAARSGEEWRAGRAGTPGEAQEERRGRGWSRSRFESCRGRGGGGRPADRGADPNSNRAARWRPGGYIQDQRPRDGNM